MSVSAAAGRRVGDYAHRSGFFFPPVLFQECSGDCSYCPESRPRKVQVGSLFLQKDSGKLFVFPGKFRQAVSFPGDCTVLSEMLLTYFLCQGKTSSVFGGVELSDFFFFAKAVLC